MKKWLEKNRKKIVSFVGSFVFIIILAKVFCTVTYLFRDAGYDRNRFVGIEQEKLDMVYIGGSAVAVYWEPLKAWNDCGFTSYNYATNSIPAENIQAYLEEARTSQEPEVFVIDARAFQYYSDDPEEPGLRHGTDGMDLTSAARYKLLYDYFKNRNISEDTDIISYYLDIAKYHTNTENLGFGAVWGYKNNDGICPDKGWEWMDEYAYLEEPADFYTEERAELSENASEILHKLLTYCQDEQLKVLFVVCPYYVTREDQAKYNTIGDIVKSYGFDYLNANEHYADMGIDFSSDFYNRNHVNLFGATKYTAFLENYLVHHYNLPDHRGDADYASWDVDYQRFVQEEAAHAATVQSKMEYVQRSGEIIRQMENAGSLAEWAELASGYRYALLIATTGEYQWPQNIADQNILTRWGMKPDGEKAIRVIINDQVKYSNASDGAVAADGVLGEWGDTPYHISVENGIPRIQVNGEEAAIDQSGIHIVVFDNNYRKVVGIAAITCGEDEKMVVDFRVIEP